MTIFTIIIFSIIILLVAYILKNEFKGLKDINEALDNATIANYHDVKFYVYLKYQSYIHIILLILVELCLGGLIINEFIT